MRIKIINAIEHLLHALARRWNENWNKLKNYIKHELFAKEQNNWFVVQNLLQVNEYITCARKCVICELIALQHSAFSA